MARKKKTEEPIGFWGRMVINYLKRDHLRARRIIREANLENVRVAPKPSKKRERKVD